MISALINSVPFQIFQTGFYVDLNWLGKFVQIIVEGVGIVGLGVIVFTLILKAITTPFDIYQRIKMRKQTLVMRQMQPELEKLQKQYANDKQTYNMKMMELQKKNGISLLGACLPMLVTLVILIIAVSAFQSYARYANLSIYERMAVSYNEAVSEYIVDENGPEGSFKKEIDPENQDYYLVRSTLPNVYIFCRYEVGKENAERAYYIDVDKLYAAEKEEIHRLAGNTSPSDAEIKAACETYFNNIGAKASAAKYKEIAGKDSTDKSKPQFLWIKNVWSPDVSYRHPVQSYQEFANAVGSGIVNQAGEEVELVSIFDEVKYNNLTAELGEEKAQANGYYILIILTIGLMVLSQFITMKSQKESNKYQTVDGQGAATQKVMMVMLPLIYAITGFMWTAAFSIYIAVSSVFGIVLTLISNLFIGRIFKKKEEEALKARYTRTVPWKKDDKNQK